MPIPLSSISKLISSSLSDDEIFKMIIPFGEVNLIALVSKFNKIYLRRLLSVIIVFVMLF